MPAYQRLGRPGMPLVRALICCLLLGSAAAASIFSTASAQDNPYSASAPAADQSAGARAQGMRQTLSIVLARVSAQPAASYASLLERADNLVQQYGFEIDPATSKLMFKASFDKNGIDNALHAQGLPVFGVYAGTEEEIVTRISGIRTPRDYARTVNYLKGVAGVKRVAIDQFGRDQLLLRLRVEGGETRLSSALGSGSVLRRSADGYSLVGG